MISTAPRLILQRTGKGCDNIVAYRTKEVGTLAVMEDQEPCRVLNGTAVRIRQAPLLQPLRN